MSNKYPKKISAYISAEEYTILEKLSEDEETSVSALVRSALRQWVQKNQKRKQNDN